MTESYGEAMDDPNIDPHYDENGERITTEGIPDGAEVFGITVSGYEGDTEPALFAGALVGLACSALTTALVATSEKRPSAGKVLLAAAGPLAINVGAAFVLRQIVVPWNDLPQDPNEMID